MVKVLLRLSTEVLFVAKVNIRANRRHHNPPEGVVVAEGSDYVKPEISPPGGRLQLFVKVWEQNECHP